MRSRRNQASRTTRLQTRSPKPSLPVVDHLTPDGHVPDDAAVEQKLTQMQASKT